MNLPPPFVPEKSVLAGVGASSGIAIGQAQVYRRKVGTLPDYRLTSPRMVENELSRLVQAKDEVRARLIASKQSLPSEFIGQIGIIDAHLLLLDDPMLLKKSTQLICEDNLNAEQAIVRTIEAISVLMSKVGDAYISSRMADVEMVGLAVIGALLGDEVEAPLKVREGAILVVRDIGPAEIANIASAKIAGLVTERGGYTSHTAIVAQALELPAVVGVKNLVSGLNDGDTVIIDGRSGHVIVRPDQDALDFYRTRQQVEKSFNVEIVRCAHLPAVTLDEHKISVLGNLELEEELPAIMSYGSEGIGLYRTEFMYLNREKPPTEDDLFSVYRRVVESIAPNPVVIRTVDLGYDKMSPIMGGGRQQGGVNQALGLRGIRYCLRNKAMFRTQLRAILRASAFGQVKIMLPLVSSVDELRKAKAIIGDLEQSLARENVNFASQIPLGIMVEVPATIFVARELAEEADFFSVGTNDLIQYTLAVDRGNPDVSDIYQPLHPAILRMIKLVLDVGRETGTPVSICGDMASGQITAPILVGLGADQLSMPPAAVPKIKRIIRMSAWEELQRWALDSLNSKTALEAAQKASRHVKGKFPELHQ